MRANTWPCSSRGTFQIASKEITPSNDPGANATSARSASTSGASGQRAREAQLLRREIDAGDAEAARPQLGHDGRAVAATEIEHARAGRERGDESIHPRALDRIAHPLAAIFGPPLGDRVVTRAHDLFRRRHRATVSRLAKRARAKRAIRGQNRAALEADGWAVV
jgi:hypothetical protein